MENEEPPLPKISIIILSHKNDHFSKGYLNYSLKSVLNQVYPKLEIIIVNNNPFQIEINEKNIKLVNTNDISRGKARNIGVKNSSGNIVIFLDDDTILCDEKAISKISELAKEKDYGFGAKRFWTYPPKLFEQNNEEYLDKISQKDFEWLLSPQRAILPSGIRRETGERELFDFSFPANFGFVKRDLFERIGGFNESFEGYGVEDDYFAYCLYRESSHSFALLRDKIKILHINHPIKPKSIEEANKNNNFYLSLLEKEGIQSFNINVLFGIEDYPGEKIIDQKGEMN